MALSLLMFSGGSQFALIGVVGAGGLAGAAIATAGLLGVRKPPTDSRVFMMAKRSSSSIVAPGITGAPPRRDEATNSGGRCCGSSESPSAITTARSMTFSSSRTLPGQE